ncbi:hypothetical protein PVV74_17195 [Roseovarius sp. SK2]|uniref:hypothetical protein n=1 Tax=Roseovarius TaxID=74030 RepID=UPI00237B1E9A|nr:hypothetical protein [Roseovarius sp. SK2]MDD9727199.1 hypothetical protein [Roseovarius sp. SK2]
MKTAPFYMTICEFPDGETIASETCLPSTIDDAADAYAEHMSKFGGDATVFRIDPPNQFMAGAATDVTEDVLDRLRRRDRFGDWPEWLSPYSPEEIERDRQIERRTVRAEQARLRVV